MKSFKSLYTLGKLRVSRKALRHYALYRASRLGGAVDLAALTEFHCHESTGKLPDGCANFTQLSMRNGFANGKWALKITQDQIIEDIQSGNACKADFYSVKKLCEIFSYSRRDTFQLALARYSRSSWFWDKALDTIVASDGFWTDDARYPAHPSKGERVPDEQKKARFLDWVKAMPDKERDVFWRGMVALSEAGRKAGIPPKDWANCCAETYNLVNEQLKEST